MRTCSFFLSVQTGYAALGLYAEILNVIYDMRWCILLGMVLILCDLYWGVRESTIRYYETNDSKYKVRLSRAGRRSVNKACDYISWTLLGALVGMAVLEPLGICTHIVAASVCIGCGSLFDLSSIYGHVCRVHGITPISLKSLGIALLKKKDSDLGEALEETLNNDKRVSE